MNAVAQLEGLDFVTNESRNKSKLNYINLFKLIVWALKILNYVASEEKNK